jgi:hypothetical protein
VYVFLYFSIISISVFKSIAAAKKTMFAQDSPIRNPTTLHKSLLIICSLIPLYYLSYRFHPSYGLINSNTHHSKPLQSYTTQKFSSLWLSTHLLEPFDPAPLRAFCANSTWRPHLIFNLADANGGVGNVRAEFLDFVFYAIEAGASIILPGMARRSEAKLFDVWGAGRAEFGMMFDRGWFVEGLREACPEMKIWENVEAIGAPEEVKKVEGMFRPEYPFARRDTTREKWAEELEAWLRARGVEIAGKDGVVLEQATVVEVGRTMWEIDTRETVLGLRVGLPQVLRLNPDVRAFAGTAMAALESMFHGEFPTPLTPTDRLHQRAFYGAHLRTEADTVDAGWQTPCSETECGLNWTTQTDAYMEHAVSNDLKIIYVASGNASEIERFKVKASSHNPPLTVIDKWDLLDEPTSAELKALHWDQQALVDLEILMRCSVFGGMAKSSFAFMIAVARSAWMEEQGFVMDPWAAKHREAMVTFEDRFSKIWGRNQLNEERVPKGAWP